MCKEFVFGIILSSNSRMTQVDNLALILVWV